jgi:hypothetical protein
VTRIVGTIICGKGDGNLRRAEGYTSGSWFLADCLCYLGCREAWG